MCTIVSSVHASRVAHGQIIAPLLCLIALHSSSFSRQHSTQQSRVAHRQIALLDRSRLTLSLSRGRFSLLAVLATRSMHAHSLQVSHPRVLRLCLHVRHNMSSERFKFRNNVFTVCVHGILRMYVYAYTHGCNLQFAIVGIAQACPD